MPMPVATRSIRGVVAAGLLALTATLAPAVTSTATAVSYPSCNGTEYAVHINPRDGRAVWFPSGNGRLACGLSRYRTNQSVTAVATLQRAMNACYLTGLDDDGSFGPATERALKSVQRQIGITPDGAYGPQTRSAMAWPAFRDGRGAGCVRGSNFS